MPVVCFLFRKPVDHFFSIEKVFNAVAENLPANITVSKKILPYYSSSLGNVVRNLFFGKKLQADIYHVTGDVHYMAMAFPKQRTILTIHDCVFLYNYTGIKKWFFHRLFLKWPVAACRIVTTISEQSKKDIIRFTGCAEEKIIVIPNMVGKSITYSVRPFNTSQPVLLFIGSTPNKNLGRTIVAIRDLNCTLDIVGKISAETVLLLQQNNINYRNAFELSEQDLADKYTNADIILFPSLFEGFGLPIVEGQKAGRPVITSNISPMKDVAGEGACLVDPYDATSIKEGLLKIINDEAYRNAIVAKGLDNVKQYTASAIGERYLNIYTKILK
ncbi:MAG: glycosyltransferase family 1 protein [Bacteroidota bacterium]